MLMLCSTEFDREIEPSSSWMEWDFDDDDCPTNHDDMDLLSDEGDDEGSSSE